MPIPRTSIPKTIWAKLQTQLQKPENAVLRQALKETKQTTGNAGATVLWDPSELTLKSILAVLKREEGFTRDRQKGSCSHKLMLATITDLEKKTAA